MSELERKKVHREVVIPLEGVTLTLTVTREALLSVGAKSADVDLPDQVIHEALRNVIGAQILLGNPHDLLSSIAISLEGLAWSYRERLEKQEIKESPRRDLPLLLGREFMSNDNEELFEGRLKA